MRAIIRSNGRVSASESGTSTCEDGSKCVSAGRRQVRTSAQWTKDRAVLDVMPKLSGDCMTPFGPSQRPSAALLHKILLGVCWVCSWSPGSTVNSR